MRSVAVTKADFRIEEVILAVNVKALHSARCVVEVIVYTVYQVRDMAILKVAKEVKPLDDTPICLGKDIGIVFCRVVAVVLHR